MDGIQLLIDEHVYIKRMLQVLRNASYKVMLGEEINFDDFASMIDFVRNYADNHHHGKEEKFLFNKMIDEIGTVAEKLIRYGMLIEHDLGRLYMQQLEEALVKVKNGDDKAKIDIIANAVGYTNLLTRHIDKEDEVVFTFAKKQLSANCIDEVNVNCEKYENDTNEQGVQKKYIDLLVALESKYSL